MPMAMTVADPVSTKVRGMFSMSSESTLWFSL